MLALEDRALAAVPAATLYRILQLRSAVFVVEQACVFLEADGRDLEPSCRLLWIEDGSASDVVATARVLDDGDVRRIGRIVTATGHRRRGLAGRLVDHFLTTYEGPWVLDAQAHLAPWYADFGFEVAGDEYLDDGIPHVPMWRVGTADR